MVRACLSRRVASAFDRRSRSAAAACGFAERIAGAARLATAAAATVALALSLSASARGDAPVRTVSPDHSRTTPTHRIALYDEEGRQIRPELDEPVQPLSTRKTCGYCHDYGKIAAGWHFNAARANVPPGRPGQPWILADAATGTQLPVSARGWAGTWKPDAIGLTPWQMMSAFGRQWPGGGVGEDRTGRKSDPGSRWLLSGDLEVNCLACHNADSRQDQNCYAEQVARENYRWAAVAASGLAHVDGYVKGLPGNFDPVTMTQPDLPGWVPKVRYDLSRFNAKDEVFFNVPRKAPANRCYYCHTNYTLDAAAGDEWRRDEDVHLARGMTCADCHRNGLDHGVSRNYEGDPAAGAAGRTCRACHVGDDSARRVELRGGGHLAAPRPRHAGIPKLHLDKLSCTACHSGPVPRGQAYLVQTSRAHGLGYHAMAFDTNAVPLIAEPVFREGGDGKLAPHRMLWPAFWARLPQGTEGGSDYEHVAVTPLTPAQVIDATGWMYRFGEGRRPRPPDEAKVVKTLGILAAKGGGQPVYVTGGKMYRLDGGKLVACNNPAATPYAWPLAHDVRPAAQALGCGGAAGCVQCHATDSPFLFGQVPALSPASLGTPRAVRMIDFEGRSALFHKVFAFTFVFRPWLKVVGFAACGVLALVLLAFGMPALRWAAGRIGRRAAGGSDE